MDAKDTDTLDHGSESRCQQSSTRKAGNGYADDIEGRMSERHDLFWTEFFGITAADVRTPGLSVVSHVGLTGFRYQDSLYSTGTRS